MSAIVWAELGKAVTYKVDVRIDSVGVVVEAQCECGAGQGPSAHCKHVTCVLYAAEQFCSSGQTPLCEITCTQVRNCKLIVVNFLAFFLICMNILLTVMNYCDFLYGANFMAVGSPDISSCQSTSGESTESL